MVTMPVLSRLVVTDYGLFPGSPPGTGVDRTFEPGLTLIAGINGLGKTTLLTAILRALTGPFDLTGEGPPTQVGVSLPATAVPLRPKQLAFFRQRVADEAITSRVQLSVRFGARSLSVVRSLYDLRLIELQVDDEVARLSGKRSDQEAAYQTILADLMGLSSFVDVLLILHHVMLFHEDRPGALWDENAQRQILRALFLDKDDARRVAELERLVQTADSQARNIHARITATEEDLKEARKAEAGSAADAAQFEAEQKLLDADLEEKARLDELLIQLEQERQEVRLEHEKAKIAREEAAGAVEKVKYSALAALYPDMAEASRLVIARLLTSAKCLVCDADAEGKKAELEELVAKGFCPACGAPPEEQHNVVSHYKFEQAKLDASKKAAQVAATEETAKGQRLQRILQSYRETLVKADRLGRSIDERRARHQRLRSKLPQGVTSTHLESALIALRRQHAEWSTTLAQHASELAKLLSEKEGLVSSKAAQVRETFQRMSERLLAEPARLAEVKFKPRYTQADQAVGGARLQFPAYKAEMVAANRAGFVRREDPTDVSESQRELIDLAFRLTLVTVAAPNNAATFVMETPEASLDGVAMNRVGGALAAFAGSSENRLIVTSNLSNAGLITSLFGGKAKTKKEVTSRRARLLNLLEVAAPNRALEKDRAAYQKLLDAAVAGTAGEQ
jgi:hypothetical protein